MKRLSQAKFSRSAFVSDPRLVLAIRHIENPMAGVFDTPVTPDGSGELLHAHGQTADVVADLDGLFPVTNAQRRHHPDRLQPLPEREPWQALGGRDLEIGSRLLTSMTLLGRHMLTSIRQVSLELFVDVIDDRLMQRLLVPFQRQDIVGLRPR